MYILKYRTIFKQPKKLYSTCTVGLPLQCIFSLSLKIIITYKWLHLELINSQVELVSTNDYHISILLYDCVRICGHITLYFVSHTEYEGNDM